VNRTWPPDLDTPEHGGRCAGFRIDPDLASAIDAYARCIIGWWMSRTAYASFVPDALEQGLHERRPVHHCDLVHHSDSGVSIRQYSMHRAPGRSRHRTFVGSIGDGYDNALAETINGLHKAKAFIELDRGAPSRPSSSRR